VQPEAVICNLTGPSSQHAIPFEVTCGKEGSQPLARIAMDTSSKLLLKFDGENQSHIEAILAVWRYTRDLDSGVWCDAKSQYSHVLLLHRVCLSYY
jgi:hypothetical protein